MTEIRLSIQPIGAQWKLGKPNGTECRMLQCASPAEHTGTEVSTRCLLVLCSGWKAGSDLQSLVIESGFSLEVWADLDNFVYLH